MRRVCVCVPCGEEGCVCASAHLVSVEENWGKFHSRGPFTYFCRGQKGTAADAQQINTSKQTGNGYLMRRALLLHDQSRHPLWLKAPHAPCCFFSCTFEIIPFRGTSEGSAKRAKLRLIWERQLDFTGRGCISEPNGL